MKTVRVVCLLCLLLVGLLAVSSGIALAQDEGQGTMDRIALSTNFPSVEGTAGTVFDFEVQLNYVATTDRVFDVSVVAPRGWNAYVTPQYETNKKISSIKESASFNGITDTVKVYAISPSFPLPEPGDNKIKFQVSSANLTASIILVAKITGTYRLDTLSANQLYNTTAKAGGDNIYSILVQNNGTDSINKITFSSIKPDGWSIDYKPDKIDVLAATSQQTVELDIKPPARAIAGDYYVILSVAGDKASAQDMSVRVTVETSTVWGWVGVAIIVIVIAGLFVIFIRFGRR